MRRSTACFALCVSLTVSGALVAGVAWADQPQRIIRSATSADGLEFDAERKELFRGFAPHLIVLADGDWLVLFRAVDEDIPTAPPELMMSTSRNEGRTWSAPRRSQVIGKRGVLRPGRLALVALPDGSMRMVYARATTRSTPATNDADLEKRRDARNSTTWSLRFADSKKGLFFRDGGRMAALGSFDREPTVSAIFHEGRQHVFAHGDDVDAQSLRQVVDLFFGRLDTSKLDDVDARSLRHAICPAGMSFVRLADARMQDGAPLESIVATGDGFRGYATTDEGIESWSSPDGREWSHDEGVRVADGASPTVIRKRDGSYFMLFAAKREERPSQRVTADVVASGLSGSSGMVEALSIAEGSSFIDASGGEALPSSPVGETEGEGRETGEATLESEGMEDGSPLGGEAPIIFDPSEIEEFAGASSLPGFAPLPDFEKPVDYLAWYRQASGETAATDNAYDAYAQFMPGPRKEADGESDWPEFHDMFHDDEGDTIPSPWDPDRHPDWTACNDQIQELLAQFGEAARHDHYATAVEFYAETLDKEGKQRVLFELMLPALSGHRALSKATLADGWRLRKGKLDTEKLIKSWETVLRNANHMKQGMTLIEELVGIAEQRLMRESALAALHQRLLPPKQLRATLGVLQDWDRVPRDPLISIRGEHAAAMDAVQFLFSPAPDGQLRANAARWEAVLSGMGGMGPDITQMTGSDISDAVRAFDEAYRQVGEQMSVGYPLVRERDIDAVTETYVHQSPLTEALMPSLSRVHVLRARGEAWRLATQLVYALHVFHAENDRWPATLEEFPVEPGVDIRIDPFTGSFFGYRIDEDGPRLYSLSENARDDGGIHSPRWGDQSDAATSSDDFVFWPMQP